MCLSLRLERDPRDVTQLSCHAFTHFAVRRLRPASAVSDRAQGVRWCRRACYASPSGQAFNSVHVAHAADAGAQWRYAPD